MKTRLDVLVAMDPLKHLDPRWDTSLALIHEFNRRGHRVWTADSPDFWLENLNVFAKASPIESKSSRHFHLLKAQKKILTDFQLILIRKEPPFDANYLYLTYLLEHVADLIPVVNHPRGIRNANEKLAILNFPNWIPETLVSCNPNQILEFQRKLRDDVVLKPLNLKGGEGVELLKWKSPKVPSMLQRATKRGKEWLLVQRFIKTENQADRRILILNGEILCVFEKRPAGKEFRANLSLGATAHPSKPTEEDWEMIHEMKPFLLKEGLLFVAIDVMQNKLIEMNVTCPSGLVDAKALYPHLALVEEWADSLEALASSRK